MHKLLLVPLFIYHLKFVLVNCIIIKVIYGAWVVCFMNLLQKKDLLMEILLMLFKKEIILKIINNDYTKIQTKIDSRLKNLIYKMLSTDPE